MTINGGIKGEMVWTWNMRTFPFLTNQACHCVAILFLLRTFGVAALSQSAMVTSPKPGKNTQNETLLNLILNLNLKFFTLFL